MFQKKNVYVTNNHFPKNESDEIHEYLLEDDEEDDNRARCSTQLRYLNHLKNKHETQFQLR